MVAVPAQPKALTRLLLGDHSLSIERLRYPARYRLAVPREERLCRFCREAIEDEVHALLACEAQLPLVKLRGTFLADVFECDSVLNEAFETLSPHAFLCRVVSSRAAVTRLANATFLQDSTLLSIFPLVTCPISIVSFEGLATVAYIRLMYVGAPFSLFSPFTSSVLMAYDIKTERPPSPHLQHQKHQFRFQLDTPPGSLPPSRDILEPPPRFPPRMAMAWPPGAPAYTLPFATTLDRLAVPGDYDSEPDQDDVPSKNTNGKPVWRCSSKACDQCCKSKRRCERETGNACSWGRSARSSGPAGSAARPMGTSMR
ncbi:hypothetical protein DFH09DRAFT_1074010 [Mycena vulgaris]|nr:hypothetical protein DFH09DRAFT_1074010 [Mycena vulgaris]